MKLRKTIKGDIGYLKVNWTNTAQTSLYWTTGNNNYYINEDMYGKLKYIPLQLPRTDVVTADSSLLLSSLSLCTLDSGYSTHN